MTLHITTPVDGTIYNRRTLNLHQGSLQIRVEGRCSGDARVTVNGAPAARSGTLLHAAVTPAPGVNRLTITADSASGRQSQTIRVFNDAASFPRYRMAIDDNIFFLRELVNDRSRSLFDHFYLAGLRRLHQRFDAAFLLNLFFTDGADFDLTHVPDRYREEWQDNAHWLKLAFHARSEFPDRPYQTAPPARLLADMDQVEEQITRFAGPATLAPLSVLHWVEMSPDARPALAGRGIRCLGGLFRGDAGTDLAYQLPPMQAACAATSDGVVDFDSNILFTRIDMVPNSTPIEKIVPLLEGLASNPAQAEIMDIVTHEQYFYPFYTRYLPDHFQRLETALRWLADHGYRSVFFHEGFAGA